MGEQQEQQQQSQLPSFAFSFTICQLPADQQSSIGRVCRPCCHPQALIPLFIYLFSILSLPLSLRWIVFCLSSFGAISLFMFLSLCVCVWVCGPSISAEGILWCPIEASVSQCVSASDANNNRPGEACPRQAGKFSLFLWKKGLYC